MSKLSNLLEDMISLARAHAGVPMKRHLHEGLTIEVRAVSNEIRLTISREDKYPSMDEWRTIMNHFPYPVDRVTEPAAATEGSRYIMTARIPLNQSALWKYR